MNRVPLGGERIHSGNKMDVTMHGYDRANFNLSKHWLSTMSAGTIMPCLSAVALPGDTWDIDYNMDIKTLPLIGPMFGTFDWAIDTYSTPLRIYLPKLQMNMVDVGLEMESIFLPTITWTSTEYEHPAGSGEVDFDNIETNPSCLLANLGYRGGVFTNNSTFTTWNGVKWLIYWDIFKQYYSNKQEENAFVVHTPITTVVTTVDEIRYKAPVTGAEQVVGNANLGTQTNIVVSPLGSFEVDFTGSLPDDTTIMLNWSNGDRTALNQVARYIDTNPAGTLNYDITSVPQGGLARLKSWSYVTNTEVRINPIELTSFPLKNIDLIKQSILSKALENTPYNINDFDYPPYNLVLNTDTQTNQRCNLQSQEGLAVKTYDSDFANNWIRTEFIDGTTGVNAMSAVAVVDDKFTIDAFILHEKIYNMLNRVALSGGTYNDWQMAIYDTKPFVQASNPMYMGGLRKKLVFQEIVSNAAAEDGSQPLGTLAGKGTMSDKHLGGHVTIKVGEMSYITAVVHGTPNIKYSQGNAWDNELATMNDFFKPALNGIGFQDTPTWKFAWWSKQNIDGTTIVRSAGKQTAWIDYQTNFDTTHGDFAIKNNSMWMTLNRMYKPDPATGAITDLTTYIDPSKFNYIFANTALDSQNFWVQIVMKIHVRRKMAANQIPNL